MPLTLETGKTKNGKKFIYREGGWADFMESCQMPAENWGSKSSRENSDRFAGASWEGALELANYGWPEGRRDFHQYMAAAVQKLESNRPAFGFDVAGMYPQVPRFVAGDPMSMVTDDPQFSRSKRIIPIYVSCSFSASVDKQRIINRGSAICGLIDIIEDANNSVELIVYEHTQGESIREWCDIRLKAAGEPLDLDRLAFALAHPAFLRRLNFARQESQGALFDGDYRKEFQWGYGVPGKGGPPDYHPRHDNNGFLHFDSLTSGDDVPFKTIESAAKAVTEEWERALDSLNNNS